MRNPIDLPCPNPYRNGQHETYIMNGLIICKACGAQEMKPPMDTSVRLRVINDLYDAAADFLLAINKRSSNSKQAAKDRLEALLHRPCVQDALDELDPGRLRYSEFNDGMWMVPEEYKKQRQAMNPPESVTVSKTETQEFIERLESRFGRAIRLKEEKGLYTVFIVIGSGAYQRQHIQVKLCPQARQSPAGVWRYSISYTLNGRHYESKTTIEFDKILALTIDAVEKIMNIANPPESKDSPSENSLYFRLRAMAVTNGGDGTCSIDAKYEKFRGVNFNREGALNFAKTLVDLGFDSVTIELGPNSALVSWK